MASTIACEVFESAGVARAAGAPAASESEERDLSELRELQFQGLWARVELEALFAAGLVSH